MNIDATLVPGQEDGRALSVIGILDRPSAPAA
jgi:hypothetical protein